ncbi:methyltransferase domain-containing protein [Acidisoma cellulosilytica]|uniref:Methyltransferase domain-containing protein n=1 Tax=Acidisoma cellulosilyticum TaxID=2802395 RepID=A0A963Z1E6_9PROT|nr:methyltransferase domain-containing protein [Acidisoma cellulosilyticum]
MTSAPDYPDVYNPDLLDRIPLDADVVLDIGCHKGALGAAYRLRNPRARVLGIDFMPEAVKVAAGRLNEVACIDIERDPLPFEVPGGYDCIVYGDVLEHLRDPWRVMREHAALLSPRGVMVICVPNAAHWSVPLRLINGSFDYEDQGVLDRTHLRWFTLATMEKALVATGLQACDVTPRIFDNKGAEAAADLLKDVLPAMGLSRDTFLSRSAPVQFVWRARKSPTQPIAVRSTMLKPFGAVSDIRVVYPLRALKTDPSISVQIGDIDSFPAPNEHQPAVCILHRPLLLGEEGAKVFRHLMQKGFLVVTEFDDLPDFMPELRDPSLMNFRAAHAVQTSTEILAEALRQQNPEVAVFLNGISELPPIANFATPEAVTLFFGAINRTVDWQPYMATLNAAASVLGPELRFQVVHDQAFFDALETPYKTFTPICDHRTYMGLLAQSEISFIPLLDSAFNRAKSDLKFIEAASARVVPLASPTVYENSIEDGVTGLIFRSESDLYEKIIRLVTAPGLGATIGNAARKSVAQTRMDAYGVAARIAWYRSLLARREALTQAIYDRVPELAP